MMNLSFGAGRTTKAMAGMVAGALLATASAQAQLQVFQATEDTTVESEFELTFTDFGLTTSAKVISTEFDLQVNTRDRTALFTRYHQTVEPLLLPGPDNTQISTGDLTIDVVPGSSSGTYNPDTGQFSTSEEYEIAFTGDLSAFGLTSPVVLPSSSTGTVSDDGNVRTIRMSWAGVGQLANPSDPQHPLNFNYTCRVNTVYEIAPAALVVAQTLCGLLGGGAAAMAPMWVLGMWFVRTRFHAPRR